MIHRNEWYMINNKYQINNEIHCSISNAKNEPCILSILSCITNAKKTEIYLSGPMTAAIIQPDKQKENTVNTALLMPLRINN